MKNTHIDVTEIYTQFDKVLEKLKSFLENCDRPEAIEYIQKLTDESHAIRQTPLLSLAFIGQYSAGKSTIISALTGNRSIKIAADITTDIATFYPWNGIKIWDTPGIGTEHSDHDEITYAALEQADLLVFCTTHMLLDSHIVQHFKKLAYEKSYGHKMILVFNKLSAEAGDDDEKIANYRASITQALYPDNLDDLTLCFFDAKDYCEGLDTQDDDLIELSRFTDFIEALNVFVRSRGRLAQLDTPIRRVLGYTETVQSWFVQLPEQDAVFVEALNRLVRRLREERAQLSIEVKRLALKCHTEVRRIGSDFANKIVDLDSQEEVELKQKDIEIDLESLWNKTETELQSIFEDSIESLQDEVSHVLNSSLIQDFIARLDYAEELKSGYKLHNFNFETLRTQIGFLQDFGEVFGIKIEAIATRKLLRLPGGGGKLRAVDVAGGNLHRFVKTVGKAVGYKFKPFGAIGIAKNIGNAARFIGPILGILGGIAQVAELYEQNRQAQQIREVQGKIDSEFSKIAVKFENQIYEQQNRFEEQTYEYLEMQIKTERNKYCNRQTENTAQSKQLAAVQTQLNELIMRIKSASFEL